jgi:hypothetical protein
MRARPRRKARSGRVLAQNDELAESEPRSTEPLVQPSKEQEVNGEAITKSILKKAKKVS